MNKLQERRISVLEKHSGTKDKAEKNRLGQFATPASVANDIVKYCLNQTRISEIRFLEPGFGSGSFFNSLLDSVHAEAKQKITEACGFETDEWFYNEALKLYKGTSLKLDQKDFTTASPKEFDLILCNPPYVRHHHIDSRRKTQLAQEVNKRYNLKVSGYTGLYNYFMILGEQWLSDQGLAAWLVPSEFMDVNYGVEIKKFLKKNVKLIRIHLYASEDVQFQDALVSSAIVFYRKGTPKKDNKIEISYGGSLLKPSFNTKVCIEDLDETKKWTRLFKKIANGGSAISQQKQAGTKLLLKDFFDIKRGLATGNNKFFILSEETVLKSQLPLEILCPILPSPRYLKQNVIESDSNGFPVNIERLYLLNCKESEDQLKERYPTVWTYLQTGIGSVDQSYLCQSRKQWYYQEIREAAPIMCTYMGRGKSIKSNPFRFILNKTKAIATNSYLMLYPKKAWFHPNADNSDIIEKVWELLSRINPDDIIGQGRTYGGGLEKIEPSELGNVPIPAVAAFLNSLTGSKSR